MTTLTESHMKEDGSRPATKGPRPVTLKPVDDNDKPRHVYRIRKSDYVTLPPIEPKGLYCFSIWTMNLINVE